MCTVAKATNSHRKNILSKYELTYECELQYALPLKMGFIVLHVSYNSLTCLRVLSLLNT